MILKKRTIVLPPTKIREVSGKMDIRVIDLIKASKGTKLKNYSANTTDSEENTYICLGHFDIIEIRALNDFRKQTENQAEPTVFTRIWEDFKSKWATVKLEQHIYPLYLLRDKNTTQTQSFWKLKSPCIIVSRVHFDKLNLEVSYQETLISALKNGDQENPDPSIGDVELQFEQGTVYCALYKTLELGDTVVIIKGNSLNACLEAPQRLMKCDGVGDVYSYCGIHHKLFLLDELSDIPEDYFQDNKATVEDALQQPIPYVSMRFSIHSAFYATQFWKILKVRDKEMLDQVYFVTGTADALVEYSETEHNSLSTKRVIEIIRALDQEQEVPKPGATEPEVFTRYDAFSDIITRIGSPFVENPDAKKLEKNVHDEHGQTDILEHFTNIQNNIQEEIARRLEAAPKESIPHISKDSFDWLLAQAAQIRMLLTLINNCVLDDLSLLIWPGAKAFLEILDHVIKEKQGNLSLEQIGDIERFLQGWSTLTNDILHLESQLVQNPKLQSPRVYIPASLLLYYMALLDQFGEMLLAMNAPEEKSLPQKHFYPLIAHNIGLRPSTLNVLDPCLWNDEEYAGPRPLLVSIPVSLMYNPEEVVAVLCHEYAHDAAEACRSRDTRYRCIVHAAAGLLWHLWNLDGRNTDCPLQIVAEEDFMVFLILHLRLYPSLA